MTKLSWYLFLHASRLLISTSFRSWLLHVVYKLPAYYTRKWCCYWGNQHHQNLYIDLDTWKDASLVVTLEWLQYVCSLGGKNDLELATYIFFSVCKTFFWFMILPFSTLIIGWFRTIQIISLSIISFFFDLLCVASHRITSHRMIINSHVLKWRCLIFIIQLG